MPPDFFNKLLRLAKPIPDLRSTGKDGFVDPKKKDFFKENKVEEITSLKNFRNCYLRSTGCFLRYNDKTNLANPHSAPHSHPKSMLTSSALQKRLLSSVGTKDLV